jgi:hypothetical protein
MLRISKRFVIWSATECLQDFFERHGDDLYGELKHIRNALESLQASLTFVQKATHHSRQIELLASAHRLICAQRGRHLDRANADQMDLFCSAVFRPALTCQITRVTRGIVG